MSQKTITYDDLLKAIGAKPIHLALFFQMGLAGLVDGAQSTALALSLPLIQQSNPSFDEIQQSFMVMVSFIGALFGGLFTGLFSDQYGRKPFIVWMAFLASLFSPIVSFTSYNYTLLVATRTIFTFAVKATLPATFSYLAENTPIQIRGLVLSLVGCNYVLGQVLLLVCFQNLKEQQILEDWKLLFLLPTVPIFILLISSRFMLRESARFQLLVGNFDEGWQTVLSQGFKKEINKVDLKSINNHQYINLESLQIDANKQLDEYKEGLQKWRTKIRDNMQISSKNNMASIKQMFQGKMMVLIIVLLFVWFMTAFNFQGLNIILPISLAKISNEPQTETSIVNSVLVACLAELPAPIIAWIMIESKTLQRRYSIIFAMLGQLLCNVMIISRLVPFIVCCSISRFCAQLQYNLIYTFTIELFSTQIRAKGLSVCSSSAALGSVVVPWVLYFEQFDIYFPYYVVAVLSGLGILLMRTINYETQGKGLDQVHNQ